MTYSSSVSMKTVFSTLFEINSTFFDRPLGRRVKKPEVGFNDTPSRSLQRRIRLEFMDELVDQNSYYTTRDLTKFLKRWKNTAIGG